MIRILLDAGIDKEKAEKILEYIKLTGQDVEQCCIDVVNTMNHMNLQGIKDIEIHVAELQQPKYFEPRGVIPNNFYKRHRNAQIKH